MWLVVFHQYAYFMCLTACLSVFCGVTARIGNKKKVINVTYYYYVTLSGLHKATFIVKILLIHLFRSEKLPWNPRKKEKKHIKSHWKFETRHMNNLEHDAKDLVIWRNENWTPLLKCKALSLNRAELIIHLTPYLPWTKKGPQSRSPWVF